MTRRKNSRDASIADNPYGGDAREAAIRELALKTLAASRVQLVNGNYTAEYHIDKAFEFAETFMDYCERREKRKEEEAKRREEEAEAENENPKLDQDEDEQKDEQDESDKKDDEKDEGKTDQTVQRPLGMGTSSVPGSK